METFLGCCGFCSDIFRLQVSSGVASSLRTVLFCWVHLGVELCCRLIVILKVHSPQQGRVESEVDKKEFII